MSFHRVQHLEVSQRIRVCFFWRAEMSRSRQPGLCPAWQLYMRHAVYQWNKISSGSRRRRPCWPKPGMFKICSFSALFLFYPYRTSISSRTLKMADRDDDDSAELCIISGGLGRFTSAVALMGFFIMQKSANTSARMLYELGLGVSLLQSGAIPRYCRM